MTGKSTAQLLEAGLAYPLVDADLTARQLVEPGQQARLGRLDESGP